MRPVLRGDPPTDAAGNPVALTHYKDARDPLIARIGDYCSYCEVALHSTVDVEHVMPKSLNRVLTLEWSNFLIACTNCNSIKSNKPVRIADYYWPDQDNTLRAFLYERDEPPQMATRGSADSTTTQRTLELTGLDRVPGHPSFSDRDRRWQKRMQAWSNAILSHSNLAIIDCPEMREQIIIAAKATGFWSVWYHVFVRDRDMCERLIKAFVGTARDCFDPQTLGVVARPGGAI